MHLIRAFLQATLYWYTTPWCPKLAFSAKSLRKLLPFGGGMLLSTLTAQASSSLSTVTIGRVYSISDLGLFSKAGDIALSPCRAISSSLTRVAFPFFSHIQENRLDLVESMRNTAKLTALFSFPVAAGIAGIAETFVTALLPSTWHGSIPLIQLLCIPAAFYPLSDVHLNALKAIGRADLFFRIEIIKQANSIIILACTVTISLYALAVGQAVGSIINLAANSFYSSKLLGYAYTLQVRDLIP